MTDHFQEITLRPIGRVRRLSPDQDDRDRSLVASVVLQPHLAAALDGIEDWSHIYVITWLDRVPVVDEPMTNFPGRPEGAPNLGVLATRAPIHPNPIGLTLVELVRREVNVLWVRGLDAYDGTPVLDIKPYPDWERGRLLLVTDVRVPGWVSKIAGEPG